MDIVSALTNYIEEEYRNIKINEISPSKTFLEALVAITSISTRYLDRFSLMLALFIKNMSEVDKENFIQSYSISSDVYQKLNTVSLNWPEYTPIPDQEIGLSENEILSRRKLIILEEINKLRDIKIDSGFEWNDNMFQSRPTDRENIIGSAIAAQLAIAQGATVGDYRWANPDADFKWITTDNNLLLMDAFDVLSLYATGIQFKTALTFYARALKDSVLAIDNLEDLLQFDIEVGWPY